MAIVSGLSKYRLVGSEKVAESGGGPTIPPIKFTSWAPATVYPTGSMVENGGFGYINNGAQGTSAAAVAPGPCPARLADGTVTWTLVGPIAGVCSFDAVQKNELGLVVTGVDYGPNGFGAAEFMYVKFSGTTVAGDFVYVDRYNFLAQQLTTTNRGLVGISMGSGAAGQFGWVMIRGIHDFANLGNGASTVGAIAYESATAGRVLTTASASNAVPGVIIKVTGDATNVGAAELAWAVATGNP